MTLIHPSYIHVYLFYLDSSYQSSSFVLVVLSESIPFALPSGLLSKNLTYCPHLIQDYLEIVFDYEDLVSG